MAKHPKPEAPVSGFSEWVDCLLHPKPEALVSGSDACNAEFLPDPVLEAPVSAGAAALWPRAERPERGPRTSGAANAGAKAAEEVGMLWSEQNRKEK